MIPLCKAVPDKVFINDDFLGRFCPQFYPEIIAIGKNKTLQAGSDFEQTIYPFI
jgi:hypothetical protein